MCTLDCGDILKRKPGVIACYFPISNKGSSIKMFQMLQHIEAIGTTCQYKKKGKHVIEDCINCYVIFGQFFLFIIYKGLVGTSILHLSFSAS